MLVLIIGGFDDGDETKRVQVGIKHFRVEIVYNCNNLMLNDSHSRECVEYLEFPSPPTVFGYVFYNLDRLLLLYQGKQFGNGAEGKDMFRNVIQWDLIDASCACSQTIHI